MHKTQQMFHLYTLLYPADAGMVFLCFFFKFDIFNMIQLTAQLVVLRQKEAAAGETSNKIILIISYILFTNTHSNYRQVRKFGIYIILSYLIRKQMDCNQSKLKNWQT